MRECPNCGKEVAAEATFCANCGTNTEAEPTSEGIVVGTPDDDSDSGGQTMMMQVDLSLFEDEDTASVDIVDPRSGAPEKKPDQKPAPAATPPAREEPRQAPPRERRAPAKTMVGIPLAEQLAKQAAAAPPKQAAPPQQTAPPRQATPPAAAVGRRPPAKTMVGIPLAEQLAKQEAAQSPKPAAGPRPTPPVERPKPSTKTMVGVPLAEQLAKQAAAEATAKQAAAPAAQTPLAPDLADEDEKTSMMPAMTLEEIERLTAGPSSPDAPSADAPAAQATPAQATPAPEPVAPSASASLVADEPEEEPEPTRIAEPTFAEPEPMSPEPDVRHEAEPEPTRVAEPHVAAAAPVDGEPDRSLPELPPYPAEPDALQPPPAPAALFGAMGYAFKTLGLGGKIRKSLATAERRRELLQASRDEVLVSIGQQAWQGGIRTPALEAHRDAIQQAQSASADLEEQIAALDQAFADEEAKVQAENEARTERAEGLERQHAERDRVFQQTARETKEASQTLKDTEKEAASLEKTIEKLRGTPDDKKAPDHGEKLSEAEREYAIHQEHLPGLQARVAELTELRDQQKGEVHELRNQIKEERAAIAEAEKGLKQSAKELEGQKAGLRGEIAGAEAGMRGPLMAAGAELFADRGRHPALAPQFASVDQHDSAIREEAQHEVRYRAVEQAYQPAVARKGWGVIGASVAVIAVIVVVAILLLGGALSGGGSGLPSKVKNAIPKDVVVVGSVDVDGLLETPLVKRVQGKLGDQIQSGLGQAGEVMKALEAKPSDIDGVTFGFQFPKGGGEPLMMAVIDAKIDAAKVVEVFKKEGFEETTTDSGATKLVKRKKQLIIADGLFLVTEGHGEALLAASPLLAGGGAPSVADNEALMAISGEVDTSANAWVAFVVPEGAERMLRGLPFEAKPGDRIAASLDLSDGIHFSAHVVLTEEARAEQLEKLAKAGLEEAKKNIGEAATEIPPLAALGDDLKKTLDDVSITRSGAAVHVAAHVPQALIDRALDLLEPMMGMFLQGGL